MGIGWGGGVGGSWGRGKTHLGWGWGQVYSPNASMSLVHSHPPSQNIWTKFARHENRGTVPRVCVYVCMCVCVYVCTISATLQQVKRNIAILGGLACVVVQSGQW